MLDPYQPPRCHSIQLRLCAEDSSTFTPSISKIKSFHLSSGNGIRVNTHLARPVLGVIGSDFDNLIAKVIVTASTRESMLHKARRALQDANISGVKSNLNLLRAIVEDSNFQEGQVDTSWLEQNVTRPHEQGQQLTNAVNTAPLTLQSYQQHRVPSNSLMLRKGDTRSLSLTPLNPQTNNQQHQERKHHIHLTRLLRNEFPTSLTAEISHTIILSSSSNPTTAPYQISMQSTTTPSSVLMSSAHRLGDPNSLSHITIPMAGKLVEVLVQEGDMIKEGQVLAFLKQMKMELGIRGPSSGRVKWAMEGEERGGGVLLVELEGENVSYRLTVYI